MFKRTCLSAVVVGSLVLVGCSPKKPEVQEAPRGIDLETELTEAGAEPREQLRYKRVAGLSEDLAIEFGLDTVWETRLGSAGITAPVLALGLSVGKSETVSEGLFRYPFKFRVIGIDMPEGTTQEQAAEVAASVAPLAAITGVLEVDDRGITRKADIQAPVEIPPRLMTLLGNVRTSLITVPLPTEAVGIGARWQVKRLHKVGNIETTQTLVYTLLERKERVLRLGVSMTQSALPQEVTLNAETTFHVDAFEMTGYGTSVLSLDAITPLGELRGSSELRGVVRRGDKSEQLRAQGAIAVVVAPLAALKAPEATPPSAPPVSTQQ